MAYRTLVLLLVSFVFLYPITTEAQFFNTLKPGDTGQHVSLLQRMLNAIGEYVTPPGEETTYFGTQTAAAIQSLQCKYGIVCSGTPGTTGFGIVGPKTRALLESLFPQGLFSGRSQTAAAPLAGSGLVAHYALDEGSGTSASDSASALTATLVGGASFTSGKVGSGAVVFDGTSGYLQMPASPPLPELAVSPFSVAVWVKLAKTGSKVGILRERGNVNRGWELNVDASGAVEVVGYGMAGSVARTGAAITDTGWHHIALVRSGSAYTVYVDGQAVSLVTEPTTLPLNGTGNLYAGAAAPTTGTPTLFYAYTIDDIRLYNVALSAGDVASVYGLAGTVNEPVTPRTPTQTPTATTHVLSVTAQGAGTVSGTGISCGADCRESVVAGTRVTLTAAPQAGATFGGWSGACSGMQTSCTVTVTSATAVTATFTATPAQTSAATRLTRNSGGTDFVWELNCGGKACTYGTFVNGEYWVVPIDVDGRPTGTVTITSIAPLGSEHGAESNPSSATTQGIIKGYSHYVDSKNLMTKLPYAARPGESIIKAYTTKGSACGTKAILDGCARTYDVLTVLDSVPPNYGATIFRPPFHGTWKPLYSVDKVRWERLPSMAVISGTRSAAQFDAIVAAAKKRWSVPHYDTMHSLATGEFMRATTPDDVLPDYAADQAVTYISDLTNMFGTESVAAKRPAVLALMQKGIDVYSVFKLGIPFNSGAGQHLGKKPALVFFAAMYDDPAMVQEVRGIASNPTYLAQGFFQEDSQISVGVDGVVLWGERDLTSAGIGAYWSQLFGEWQARNRGAATYDNKGTRGDPYGFIDGPAGGPDPVNSAGRDYQFCCSAGPIMGFAFTTLVMPWMDYVQNDWELVSYVDRIWNGRGLPGFSGGYWSQHDECAPPDPRESASCTPHQNGKGCKYYGVTWGPSPGNALMCIKTNDASLTQGRWPMLHGFNSPTNGGSLLRVPPHARQLWSTLRECADPKHATYPCRGLGAVPPKRTEQPKTVVPVSLPVPTAGGSSIVTPSVATTKASTRTTSETTTTARTTTKKTTARASTSQTTSAPSTERPGSTRLALTRQLSVGARGDDVVSLQTYLKQVGHYTYPEITGFYGEMTRQAVAAYQRAQGLEAVGSVGPRTLAVLAGTSTSLPSGSAVTSSQTFVRDLTLGSTGEDVRALQVFLNAQGYIVAGTGPGSVGAETVYFGEATRRALALFQSARGITPASGYFGPVTRTIVSAASR